MAIPTLSQLKSRDWPSREAAIKDLKASGLRERGSDYQLGEYKPGSWQLLDLTDDVSQEAPPEIERPKAQKKAHPADTADLARIAEAASFNVHFRVSAKQKIDRTAATLAEARTIRDALNAEHGGKGGRRAGVYALPKGKGAPVMVPDDYVPAAAAKMQPAPKVTQLPERPARGVKSPQKTAPPKKAAKGNGKAAPPPAPAPEPPEPANDLSPLPAEGGPYGLRVGEAVAQHDIARVALSWSQKIGFLVAITDKAGKVVRVIDGRLGGRRAQRSVTRAATGAATKGPRSEGKSAQAAALLFRAKGATMAEIVAVTEWSFGERYIRRLAGSHNATIETLGTKHWRLVKPA